jgi:hypothetical protein
LRLIELGRKESQCSRANQGRNPAGLPDDYLLAGEAKQCDELEKLRNSEFPA